ncbi:hydrogenase maturation nickel metallochaperone HypA [Heliorestis acidaminivorans]|uniref:Hydrogenase maturation factor HypA n=1 Tax=Heliorestis acidaminivorans TaxID=553427 RepID=A0A6I0EYU9_9FIRM|nr:hydrogenase maturation nickel metallochaperone HypA [Heliorestis acidaminivorans]KAB2951776.1 hydrogenase maturation nickel metallochaperone HypA [Heliorestis acidaminivorans]
MHEMALMESLVSVLREEAEKNDIKEIKKVKMTVGTLTHALPSALQFAFTVLRESTPFAPLATLEIETVSAQAKCLACAQTFDVSDEYLFTCPHCQAFTIKIIAGRELKIDYFEGE